MHTFKCMYIFRKVNGKCTKQSCKLLMKSRYHVGENFMKTVPVVCQTQWSIACFLPRTHVANINTLERPYYGDPYNAETVITRLVCSSHFFFVQFFPNFGSFALFPWSSADKKIISHDHMLANLHILKVVISILYFGYFRALYM